MSPERFHLVNIPLRGEQLKFRLLWIGIFLIMLLFASVTYPQNTFPLRTINRVLLIATLWHVLVFFTPLARRLGRFFDALTILIDVILITWVVRATGGFLSDLGLLYFVELLLAALFTGAPTLLVSFIFSALGLCSTLFSFQIGAATTLNSDTVLVRLGRWKPEDLSALGVRTVGLAAIYLIGYVGRLLVQKTSPAESRLPSGAISPSILSSAPSSAVVESPSPESTSEPPVREHLSVISHELRSPLTILRAYTDLLMDPNRQNGTEEIVTKIDEEVSLLSEMVGNLEAIIDERAIPPSESLKVLNLATVLHSLIERFKSTHSLYEWILRSPYSDIRVRGDRTKLIRAFSNLLANAVKYSPAGGRIEVQCDIQDRRQLQFLSPVLAGAGAPMQFAVIRITDSGIGMSRQALSAAFEKFRRLDVERTQGIPGAGLGLYLTRKIVEQHRGGVWLESKEGLGTTVTVALPTIAKGEMSDT